jgi:hypothetical protein
MFGYAHARNGSFSSILACPQHVRLGVNLGNADCPVLPVEGIGLDVIQTARDRTSAPATRSSVTGRCGACHRARIRATRWHHRESAVPRPGHEWNLLAPLSSDLPVGQFCVESHLQKYFASPVGQIISTNSRHPTPHKGRIAIVTDAGWDAVDAAASGAQRDAGRVGERPVSDQTAR